MTTPSRAWAQLQDLWQEGTSEKILRRLVERVFRPDVDARTIVEICCGATPLSKDIQAMLPFRTVLVDTDGAALERARSSFENENHGVSADMRTVQTWVTVRHVKPLLQKHLLGERLGVLIVDMDGNEFWILKALLAEDDYRPRLVVTKFQDILGPERACTIPYREQFRAWRVSTNREAGECNFAGASLTAFARLLTPRGYHLVGLSRAGYTAFFARLEDDTMDMALHPDEWADVFSRIPKVKDGMTRRYPKVSDEPWEDVPVEV